MQPHIAHFLPHPVPPPSGATAATVEIAPCLLATSARAGPPPSASACTRAPAGALRAAATCSRAHAERGSALSRPRERGLPPQPLRSPSDDGRAQASRRRAGVGRARPRQRWSRRSLCCGRSSRRLRDAALAQRASSGDDPASVVPASAPLYAGAVVRPEEPAEERARVGRDERSPTKPTPTCACSGCCRRRAADRSTISTTSRPGSALRRIFLLAQRRCGTVAGRLLSRAARAARAARSAATRAGSRSAARGLQGAVVLDTTDAGKAGSFLTREARTAGAHAASYRGVAYQRDLETASRSGSSIASR